MKRSFLILAIFGILLILFGGVFALQGDGILPGSAMSGVSFWRYTGSVIALLGLVLAVVAFVIGSRSGKQKTAIEGKHDSPTRPDSSTQ
jgi:hypothetical protein